jgi:hypothetical protein
VIWGGAAWAFGLRIEEWMLERVGREDEKEGVNGRRERTIPVVHREIRHIASWSSRCRGRIHGAQLH